MKRKCEIEGCNADYYAKGLCKGHYMRLWRYGDLTSPRFYEQSPEERLKSKLAPQDPATGCIEWTGDRNEKGYGRLMLDRKMFYTHRLAWALKNGPIPRGKKVRHTCDNPPCCNEEHLCLGTQQDNMTDMVVRGRSPRGSQRPNSKLTEADVAEIRRRLAAGEKQTVIADGLGISQTVVSRIKLGKNWKHTYHPPTTP